MTRKGFGDRLAQERRHKSVRLARDVLKKDVAKAVGVSESTVGRWESGESVPDDNAMLELARYFGVTPAWLRYGQEPREAAVEPKVGETERDPRVKHRRTDGGRKEA